MNRMFIDLETRSDADITKTGVYRYADSPYGSNEIIRNYFMDTEALRILSVIISILNRGDALW